MEKRKILIIDDEREICLVLAEILESQGFEVKRASSAWKALNVIHEFYPDLLLLDVMMPIISGLEFLKKFREISKFKTTPVILMSAIRINARQEDYDWNEFVQKPFNLNYILACIQKCLVLK